MIRPARPFAWGLVLALCAGCALTPRPKYAVRPPPPDPKTQMHALETRVEQLIDAERKTLDPKARTLTIDPVLADVARKRSADMAARHYFADKAPDGTTSASLVMDEDANFQGLLGVNIAAEHYTKLGGVDVDAFAKAFVATWMKSPSHKQNLAFPDYNRTGVGAAVDGDTVYVTELFATDLGLPPPHDQSKPQKATKETSPQAAKSELVSQARKALRQRHATAAVLPRGALPE